MDNEQGHLARERALMTEPSAAGLGESVPVAAPGDGNVSASVPPTAEALPTLWHRLTQRKVVQWTLAYAAAAYTLLHGAEMLGEALDWPHMLIRLLTLVLILGAPVAALLAWYHGEKGLQRVSGMELAIFTVLAIIAGSVLWSMARTKVEGGVGAASMSTELAAQTTTRTASRAAAPRTSIAVMPFENQTGDVHKAYLGEGMATELINTLTRVPGLRVPARTSSFAYRGRNVDARQIAQDLGVGTLLEGAVQVSGDRIRITADLVNASDGLHVWSETYERRLTDLFELQDEITGAIVAALPRYLKVTPVTKVAIARPTLDLQAYELYLQGDSLIDRTSWEQALGFFRQAVARDPKFSLAWSGIAESEAGFVQSNQLNYAHVDAAEQAAQRALALDPSVARAHFVLAFVYQMRGRTLEMEVHDRAALALGPEDGLTRAIIATHLAAVGHLRRALEMARRAYALAPARPITSLFLATVQWQAGLYAEAVESANRSIALGVNRAAKPLADIFAAAALRDGHLSEARDRVVGSMHREDTDAARAMDVISLAYAAQTDSAKRAALLAAARRIYPAVGGSAMTLSMRAASTCIRAAYSLALVEFVAASYDLANRCLDRVAAPIISPDLDPLLVWAPGMRSFRRDPRFQAYATRLGLMEYWQQYGPPDDCDLKNGKLTCH
jgi:TolB-like protein/Tfp pilus assembly protein PilF